MKSKIATLALVWSLPGLAAAQQGPVVAQAIAQPQAGSAVLPANTEVMVTLNNEVTSKKARLGDKFDVSVSRDVMLGNYVVIPRGTRGRGAVVYRTGKGAFGKSGKMEIEVQSLDLAGRSVPVSGKARQEGSGNTGATVAAVATVWVAAPFIKGHSAVFEQGREIRTFTVEPLPVELSAAPVVAPAAAVAVAPAAH